MKFKVVDLPQGVQTIGNALNKNGFKAYVVGGAVRDYLLGRTPKDWDIATSAKPEDVMRIFEGMDFKIWPMGQKYGIVKVQVGTEDYDITTLRKRISFEDGKSQVAEYSDSIEEDLAFRDLTINALAIDIQTGEIIDPHGGQEDLKNGIIRAIGDPDERLKEGPIRSLRAIRFAVKYNFKLDQETANTIKRHASELKMVAGGRIKRELNTMLLLDDASRALRMLKDTGVARALFPEVNLDNAIQKINDLPKNLEERWAEILKDTGKGEKISTIVARQIMRRLGFVLAEIEKVNRLIYSKSEQKLTADDLDITEKELQKLGVSPEDMETVKNQLINLIVFRPEKNKNSILKNRVKKWKQGIAIEK